ncbi:56R [Yaba monkey tumor virus]|uniref:Protein OPG091 n=1 Tax=Yaba monkey tumor virus (strain VR587) TaxID=928314 RepID=Q6TUV7_YMTV5|nr:56R [Yaba monkey tumor virus]AAR07412.1 56R [Yaba monkey tumor virus]
MDPTTFIKNYTPKGAIIFLNYRFSLTEHFNPSEDKHAAIFIGSIPSKNKTTYECMAVESTFNNGVNTITVDNLLKDLTSVRVYILNSTDFISKMSIASESALGFLGMPYGFGKKNMYCFKLVAECYEPLGIKTPTYKLLGKKIYLSQSFKYCNTWKKIYDSETGETDISYGIISSNTYQVL